MTSIRTVSLRWGLPLVVVAVFSVAAASVVLNDRVRRAAVERRASIERVAESLTDLGHVLNEQLAAGHPEVVEAELRRLGSRPEVREVAVVDGSGKIVYSGRYPAQGGRPVEQLGDFDAEQFQSAQQVPRTAVVFWTGSVEVTGYASMSLPGGRAHRDAPRAGAVYLAYDVGPEQRRRARAGRREAVRAGLAVVPAAVLLWWLLEWLVRQPLARLVETAEALACGDTAAPIRGGAITELVRLGEAVGLLAAGRAPVPGMEERRAPAPALVRGRPAQGIDPPPPDPAPRHAQDPAGAGDPVLVVEDNEVTQDVLQRQLILLGYTPVIASSGREALAQMEQTRFSLLLTDCHMPGMDGRELTALIRRREQGTGAHLPIIAITAAALAGEADACLRQGMDDFLAKPIDLEGLARMLARWAPRPPDALPQSLVRNAAAGPPGEAPVDADALARFVGDDPEIRARILGKFVTSTAAMVVEIAAAQAAADAARVSALGHKLKSSARALGAHALGDLCETLEHSGNERDWHAIDALAVHIQGECARIEEFVTASSPSAGDR